MNIQRLTGNKEVVNILHKLNHTVSYSDVLTQNKFRASTIQHNGKAPRGLMKNIATHATLDNNDGREETANGNGTTHDTNFTMFHPLLEGNFHDGKN